jgi:hypothetical protein
MPTDGRASGEFSFHLYVLSVAARNQLGTGFVSSGIDEMDTPSLQCPVVGSYRGSIPVTLSRNAGSPVDAAGENKQILDCTPLQHPRDMELASASLRLSVGIVKDCLKLPASDQKSEYIVRISKFG